MSDDLLKRYNKVKNRIKSAALRAGRDPSEIKLVAVSKNHPVSRIKFFKKLGVNIFGESRAQELREKKKKVKGVEWHFIGHLQRNKVKYLMRMDNCKLIHSLDSMRLAKEINKRALKNNRVMPVLVQVNIAGDENKFGFEPSTVLPFINKARELDNINIKGLMTIVPYTDNPESVRPYFQELAELKEEINSHGYQLTELSMGMSNDFEVAIEEGATIVRIGTALFGPRGG